MQCALMLGDGNPKIPWVMLLSACFAVSVVSLVNYLFAGKSLLQTRASWYNSTPATARVTKSVDVVDSKSTAERRAGSSPAPGTIAESMT